MGGMWELDCACQSRGQTSFSRLISRQGRGQATFSKKPFLSVKPAKRKFFDPGHDILHQIVIPWCKMQRFAFTGKFQVETNQQSKLIEDLTNRSQALRRYL